METQTYPQSPLRARPPEDILGATPRMQRLLRLVEKIAPTDSPVLLTGESGTGKELVARAIHYQSRRADRPFLAVNCGALPENLVESELFGHVRGAFTGAAHEKRGLFEEADQGTLFLDEIAELAPPLQVKLLRALQSGEVRRVGANQSRLVDVRVIAATNKDLSAALRSGEFREDLYYRLNVFQIDLPPLRERRDDIPILALYFLTRYARRLGKDLREFSPEAQAVLLRYDYPGNVRELENAVQRAVTLAESPRVEAADLPPWMLQTGRLLAEHAGEPASLVPDVDMTLEELERRHIARTLERHDHNMSRTAKALGISRATLWRKLRRDRGA
ncbi:MAG TPA: sigma 54-interacting transcriptional regulator [Candidatus Saccharimonadales bacterium]|nr:sigma 54-interacting transcriptional regulator [Candidatus Saccharimonadales bacterium]